jgi:hypothetical protein
LGEPVINGKVIAECFAGGCGRDDDEVAASFGDFERPCLMRVQALDTAVAETVADGRCYCLRDVRKSP